LIDMDALPFSASARFGLTEDQIALRDMALGFAAEQIAPHALEWDRTRHLPLPVLRQAAALGMGAIYCREEFGGTGLGRHDAAIIFEALATGCPAISAFISIHNMVTWMIDRYGDEAQRARLIPVLAPMELIGAYCLTEPGSGSDAAALRTRAIRDGDFYVLDGVKQFISGAGVADLYLVMARAEGGISAFLVEKGTAGLSFGADEKKMGWNAQPTRAVIMEGVRVPVSSRLGEEGQGFKMAMSGLDGGRLNIGACSLGGAQAAIDKCLAYMKERQAFGQTLDQFQALQFRVADMATGLEAARTLLWRAASALDAKAADASKLCAMAKRFATDTGFEIANDALQLHGGYGYLAEYGVEKIVRDLRVHQILEGTNEIMRVIIARAVIGGK
jgi:alkylation response protein AidB-like acyl-CoA dehydrogenase